MTGTASRSDGDVERQTVARFSDVWNLAGVAVLRFGLATEALDAVRRLVVRHLSTVDGESDHETAMSAIVPSAGLPGSK